MRLRLLRVSSLALLLFACREQEAFLARTGDMAVASGFAFERGVKDMAAFVALRNLGKSEDTLVAVTTDIADTVQLHDTQPAGNGTRMVVLERLVLPPGLVVEMAPGGLHLMLSGLKVTLDPGHTLLLRLQFARAGKLVAYVPVEKTGTPP